MFKKLVVYILIVSLLCSIFSCYSMRQEDASKVLPPEKSDLKIYGVTKLNGDVITFSEDDPARIEGDRVVGKRVIKREKVFDRENIERIDRVDAGTIRIITKDGLICKVRGYQEFEDKIIIKEETEEFISIPFAEIEQVIIKKYEKGKTILVSLGFVLGTGIVVGGIIFLIEMSKME